MRRRRTLGALGALLLVVAGCSSGMPGNPVAVSSHPPTPPSTSLEVPSSSRVPPTTSAPRRTPPAPVGLAEQVLAQLSEAERVGQLLMVDCPSSGVADATLTAITQDHVGAVILDGTSDLGVQETAAVTAQLQRDAPRTVGLLIATDQEGGQVQRLQGSGFSWIPSAVTQGTYLPATLQADAQLWGSELRAAGVNVDLAPVLDTVPPNFGPNPPIGDLDREYGHDPATVTSHGVAVVRGLAAAHVAATVKHFPGLGRVTGNTDVSSGVQDSVTTRHDPFLAPFAAAIRAGAPFVMMSTAIYTRIDASRPAAFSPTVITGMLRGDLGFRGVVISDDLGAAAQVSGYSVGDRAVAFIAAGGDLVLTVDATQAAAMTQALLARAQRDPAFRAKVDAAALTVLREKQALGLLQGP